MNKLLIPKNGFYRLKIKPSNIRIWTNVLYFSSSKQI